MQATVVSLHDPLAQPETSETVVLSITESLYPKSIRSPQQSFAHRSVGYTPLSHVLSLCGVVSSFETDHHANNTAE